MWRDEYGFDPASLARLLETSPVVDQGGLTYERGDTVAVFARGTSQLPTEWSAFFVQCHEDDMCARSAPSPSDALDHAGEATVPSRTPASEARVYAAARWRG
ncbi:hypothetical protein ACWGJB_45430 [Streptomyces sp. NPDC054813]